MKRIAKTFCAAALTTAVALPSTGCFFQGYDGVFVEREDVSLDVPQTETFRGDGDGIHGDVYNLVTWTAADVNLWVTVVVESSGYVVEFLNNHRETSREGDWRVYGPFDSDRGEDLAWLVRINGDSSETSFEFLVAERGTTETGNFDKLIEGNLAIEDEMRNGTISVYFDTVEKHGDLKDPADVPKTFGGTIDINFDRNVDTEAKTIELDFIDFSVEREGYLDDDDFFSDESYRFNRNDDGSGDFHLALMGEFDTLGWSGPLMERMQLDAVWNDMGEGRTHGEIVEQEDGGDLIHGDLYIQECFDADGWLTFRNINDEYAQDLPDYNMGDEADCKYGADAFE